MGCAQRATANYEKLVAFSIAFDDNPATLKDRMADALFAYPLPVKVRVPDAWTTVAAKRAGKAIEAKLLVHEGGSVTLTRQ